MHRHVNLEYGRVFVLGSTMVVVAQGIIESCPKLLINVSMQQYRLSISHSIHVSMGTVIKCSFSDGPNRKKLLCNTPSEKKMISTVRFHTTMIKVVRRLSVKMAVGIISRFPCSVYMYVVLKIGHQAPALKKELFLYDCFRLCLFVFLINPQGKISIQCCF
jgi:hypothetical protein